MLYFIESPHLLCDQPIVIFSFLLVYEPPPLPVDPCHPNPCQNGGSCHATDEHNYKCVCPTGFEGFNCQGMELLKILIIELN